MDFCHPTQLYTSARQEKLCPLIFLRNQTRTTHSEPSALWQHQLCHCCSREQGSSSSHTFTGVPGPEPQKRQDLRIITVLLREGVLSMLTFLNTTVFRNCIGVWQDTSALYLQFLKPVRSANLPCGPQHLASHMPSYFPEGVLKNKLSGSNLIGKVTLCPYWLLACSMPTANYFCL